MHNWKSILLILFIGLTLPCSAQLRDSETGFFLVEEPKFNPPDSAIIAHYIGENARAFMAKDMQNRQQYLGDYVGGLTLIWFWNTNSPICISLLEKLNTLVMEMHHVFSLVSFADEDRKFLDQFLETHPVQFPVIPNSGIFGEGAYVKELGYPRAFFIDEKGKIIRIFPETFFTNRSEPIEDLRAIIMAHPH